MIRRNKIRDYTELTVFPSNLVEKLFNDKILKDADSLTKVSCFSAVATIFYEGYCDKCNIKLFEYCDGDLELLNEYEVVGDSLLCKGCLDEKDRLINKEVALEGGTNDKN